MGVVEVAAKRRPGPEWVERLREPAWLTEMSQRVDVMVSCAPHTRETVGMFNEAFFHGMKKTAYFLNVSRGGLVNQDALVRALKEGWIRGAGLDVTTPEPLPAEHALWDCPNLVITPHNPGYAPIRQGRLVALGVESVRRHCSGLPRLNGLDRGRR